MPHDVKIFENVLSPEDCGALIERFDRDARVQPDPQPEYSTRTYLNLSVTLDWMREVQRMTQIADPLIADFFRLPEPYRHAEQQEWLNDGWVLARYRPGDI
ncbi:MAG: hypothetical protein ACOVS5_13995, partial [Oligoflexus sp.]